MEKLSFTIVLFVFMINNLFAQQNVANKEFSIFDSMGSEVNLEKLTNSLNNADALFLGEQHDDATAHKLEFEILRMAVERYGKTRQIVVSLEMFERDVQIVIDEYLQDLINENNFIQASRAWNNYKTDYRALVEFAKTNKLPVVAANAPRRYVNRVSRLGADSLADLSLAAKDWLAPLPVARASSEYAKKFDDLMGEMGGSAGNHASVKLLEAQSLWDATMADSIAMQLKKRQKPLVIHINGGFHSENRLGAPEHLLRYAPKAKILVVTIISDPSFPNFDSKFQNKGDFVILTDPKLPRTNQVK